MRRCRLVGLQEERISRYRSQRRWFAHEVISTIKKVTWFYINLANRNDAVKTLYLPTDSDVLRQVDTSISGKSVHSNLRQSKSESQLPLLGKTDTVQTIAQPTDPEAAMYRAKSSDDVRTLYEYEPQGYLLLMCYNGIIMEPRYTPEVKSTISVPSRSLSYKVYKLRSFASSQSGSDKSLTKSVSEVCIGSDNVMSGGSRGDYSTREPKAVKSLNAIHGCQEYGETASRLAILRLLCHPETAFDRTAENDVCVTSLWQPKNVANTLKNVLFIRLPMESFQPQLLTSSLSSQMDHKSRLHVIRQALSQASSNDATLTERSWPFSDTTLQLSNSATISMRSSVSILSRSSTSQNFVAIPVKSSVYQLPDVSQKLSQPSRARTTQPTPVRASSVASRRPVSRLMTPHDRVQPSVFDSLLELIRARSSSTRDLATPSRGMTESRSLDRVPEVAKGSCSLEHTSTRQRQDDVRISVASDADDTHRKGTTGARSAPNDVKAQHDVTKMRRAHVASETMQRHESIDALNEIVIDRHDDTPRSEGRAQMAGESNKLQLQNQHLTSTHRNDDASQQNELGSSLKQENVLTVRTWVIRPNQQPFTK